jgi:hypothetical protein
VAVPQIVQGNWILNLIDREDLVCKVITLPIFMSRVELSISDAILFQWQIVRIPCFGWQNVADIFDAGLGCSRIDCSKQYFLNL